MQAEITIEIDGKQVKTRPGNNVLQAAIDAGLYIPYLCYYPGMKAFGACRMCVIEAETKGPDGSYRPVPGTPASCTTPVADGMRVRTLSDNVFQLRRGVMEMLISEHPHGCLTCHRIELCGPSDVCLRHVSVNDRCVTCPKNERCELKDTVRHLEMDMNSPLAYNLRGQPHRVSDPLWEMDLNLCIVCARCVRVCDEVRGDTALSLNERSGRALIGTSFGASLLESGCEFCGACIDVCPTGTLVERKYKWDKAVKEVKTICPHCPVGCRMNMEVDRRNRLIRPVTDIHAPANRGQACFKGHFGLDFVNKREQLQRPRIELDGALKEVPWFDAIDFVADRLRQYQNTGQYALLASPRNTNEDCYVSQKFARVVMGTNNVEVSSNTRPELTPALGEVLGYPAATNSIWELLGSKSILVVSSNLTEEQTVVGVPIKMAARNGASLVVIDQRETELTRHAKVWLRPRPDTEAALVGGMLRVIVDESLDDHEFIESRCDGVEPFKNNLWAFDLLRVERITGVPHEAIQEAARLFAKADSGAILYGLETVSPESRDAVVRHLINLALVTGNVGKPSTGLFPLFAGANEQGAKDVGCSPVNLPGYRPISSERARERVREAWGAAIPEGQGIPLGDIASAIRDGRIKALHILGDSPSFTNGALGDFLEALKGLEFLVVQDAFMSEVAELADAVLPSATFAQRDGAYTNLERRVQLLNPALALKGEEEPDWKILSQIARRMGAQAFDYASVEAIFDELRGLVPIYGGITYERMRQNNSGMQWPCMAADMSDTRTLYVGGFESGKARLCEMKLSEVPQRRDAEYPFLLAHGRVLHDPDRDAGIAEVRGRNRITRAEFIALHPDDARQAGVSDGDWVEVETARERIRGIAQLSGGHRGVVSVTTLFGEVILDMEASRHHDPALKVPTLPLLPARIQKAVAEVAAD